MNRLCMGCMQEVSSVRRPCPYCGYDEVSRQKIPHHIRPRSILNGKYLIGNVIGEGGFGITYLAFDLNLELKVAIKEYYPMGFVTRDVAYGNRVFAFQGSSEEYFRTGIDRFLNEAKALAKFINLPGIVMVKDFFMENCTAYIVMEYLEGKTLKEYLRERGGVMEANQVFEMMKPVIESLIQVHKEGIIHRDISPENIMILASGQIKLLDFGAARAMSSEGDKSLSVFVKPGYAPEEQYRVHGQQGPWTDTYAMCATMYRCITGTIPDEPIERMREDNLKSPKKLGVHIGASEDKVLLMGLSLYPETRFQTMEELYRKLYGDGTRLNAESANRIREKRRKENKKEENKKEEKDQVEASELKDSEVVRPNPFVKPNRSYRLEKCIINGKTIYRRVENEEEVQKPKEYPNQVSEGEKKTVALTEDELLREEKPIGYIINPPKRQTGPIVWDFLGDQKKEEEQIDSIVANQSRIRQEEEFRNRQRIIEQEMMERQKQLMEYNEQIKRRQQEEKRQSEKKSITIPEEINEPIVQHQSIKEKEQPKMIIHPGALDSKKHKKKNTGRMALMVFLCCMILAVVYWLVNHRQTEEEIATWTSATLEKYGALPNNVVNGGLVVTIGDSIYYQNQRDKNSLYKYNVKLKESTKLTNEAVMCLNKYQNWIYYQNSSDSSNLYRIATDGGKRSRVLNDTCSFSTIVGNWIYYIDGEKYIQRVLFSGKERQRISQAKASQMILAGDRIYYMNMADNNYLYRMNMDGSGDQCLVKEEIKSFVVEGEKIYYVLTKVQGIQCYSISTKKVASVTADSVTKLNVFDNVLIYIDESDHNKLYEIDVNKEPLQSKVLVGESVSDVSIIDDWVYFMTKETNNMLCRINVNTKERQDFTGTIVDSSKKDFEKNSE